MQTSRTRTWLSAALLSLLVSLVGCTAGVKGLDGSAPAGGSRPVPESTEAPTERSAPAPDRQVTRTGTLTVRTADITGVADKLKGLALSLGGFVSTEQLTTNTRSGTSYRTTFSVPADAMDRFMTEAAATGELVSRNVTAQDVTDQVVDVEARIRTLRDSIARIRSLMAKAGTVAEIARVEQELTNRQSELEALLARQKSLANRVERAPVTVTLLSPGQSESTNPFIQGLTGGWQALQNSIAVLLVSLGAILPFLVVGAALAYLVVRVVRSRRTASGAAHVRPVSAPDNRATAEAAVNEPGSTPGDDPSASSQE